MVVDDNDNTSNYFVLYEQAAIGGYISSTEKRAHAIMVLEDYRHIFVSGGTVGAYFLGLGYRLMSKTGSMSYYLGVASVPDIDAIGFGYRMQWMITGKEGRFGLHVNVGIDAVTGSMPACSFCEEPMYLLPFVGVGLGGMR